MCSEAVVYTKQTQKEFTKSSSFKTNSKSTINITKVNDSGEMCCGYSEWKANRIDVGSTEGRERRGAATDQGGSEQLTALKSSSSRRVDDKVRNVSHIHLSGRWIIWCCCNSPEHNQPIERVQTEASANIKSLRWTHKWLKKIKMDRFIKHSNALPVIL